MQWYVTSAGLRAKRASKLGRKRWRVSGKPWLGLSLHAYSALPRQPLRRGRPGRPARIAFVVNGVASSAKHSHCAGCLSFPLLACSCRAVACNTAQGRDGKERGVGLRWPTACNCPPSSNGQNGKNRSEADRESMKGRRRANSFGVHSSAGQAIGRRPSMFLLERQVPTG